MLRFLVALVFCVWITSANAQQPAGTSPVELKPVNYPELIKKLETQLTKSKFIGQFTTLGKEDGKLKAEEYTILSAKKAEQADLWLLTARIKYGEHDAVVPIPLQIQWAGETPVITLDKLAIPGFGTFSARVVIHENKYAGTWSHDAVGGHLFGKIEKLPEDEKPK